MVENNVPTHSQTLIRKLTNYLWVLSILYMPFLLIVFAEGSILSLIYIFSGLRVFVANYGDIQFWWYVGYLMAIRVSLLGAVFPCIIACVSISQVYRTLNRKQSSFVILSIVLSALSFLCLGGFNEVMGIQGIGPGLFGAIVILIVQTLNSNWLRTLHKEIVSIIVYCTTFVGYFIGDLLIAYRLDQFQSVVTGGFLLSDGLVLIPSLTALLIYHLHPLDESIRKLLQYVRDHH